MKSAPLERMGSQPSRHRLIDRARQGSSPGFEPLRHVNIFTNSLVKTTKANPTGLLKSSCEIFDNSLKNQFYRRARFHALQVFCQARQRGIGQHAEAFQAREARDQIGIDQ